MVDSLAVRHYAKLQKNYEQKLIFFQMLHFVQKWHFWNVIKVDNTFLFDA